MSAVSAALAIALAFASAGCGESRASQTETHARPTPSRDRNVATVAGVAIRESLVQRLLPGSVGSPAMASATPAYRAARDQVVQLLVQDAVVLLEARRRHLMPRRPTPQQNLGSDDTTRAAYEALYAFAARNVPQPADPRIVAAAHVEDPQDLKVPLTPAQLRRLHTWQHRRDRVASSWFARLFRHYGSKIAYAPGWAPRS